MHLLNKFVVVQFGQDDIFFIGHGTAPLAQRAQATFELFNLCDKQTARCGASTTESICFATKGVKTG